MTKQAETPNPEEQVKFLISAAARSAGDGDHDAAMKYAQAALNAANALCSLKTYNRPED